MDIRFKLYPYPVLAYYSDDYIDCAFNTNIELKKDGYNLKLICKAELTNKELLELVTNSQANFVYHIECAQTGYRTVLVSGANEASKIIPDGSVVGRVKVCPFVVAQADIKDFVSEQFNEDYTGYKFQIDAGCVLAIGHQNNFDVEKERNDFTNAKSIFVITKDADPNATEMSIDIDRNKITIKLAEKDYFRYKSMSQSFEVQDTLNSMIIIPALIYVLSEISRRSADDRLFDFESYNWYKSIRKAMKKHFGKDIDTEEIAPCEVVMYAQKLIKSPMMGALEYLAIGCNGGEDDDE